MNEPIRPQAVLLLADGTVFYGKPAGRIGTTTGEICFNTGMTGYQEIFTDPSYYKQLMVTTNAHIGNYGIKRSESESSAITIAGLICKNFTDEYARPLADNGIQAFFEEYNLVGISDIDTRALVRHIRSKGAMNGIISSEILDVELLAQKLAEVPSMDGLELASAVSTPTPYTMGSEDAGYRIAVLDFGVKRNILRSFAERGCFLKIFPANTTFEQLSAWNPDGYFLSNGPGDPASMHYAIETTKTILAHNKPLFGICLGHQLLALASGISTYKMHHGHRGINHPVRNIQTGLCEITSQNHGFAVTEQQVLDHPNVEVTHINLNDQTIEGIRRTDKPAFSVQYHPEAAPGPHDARYLFNTFIRLMENHS
jgi:carbamoyl-phosphate synthase small subunit